LTITIEVVNGDSIVYYADNDGDGYGNLEVSLITCVDPGEGWVTNGEDCDDDNPLVYPGAAPTGTGLDNNCDGIIDEAEEAALAVSSITQNQMLVYPIPAHSQLNVSTNDLIGLETVWSIIDLSGRIILSGREIEKNLVIDVNILPEGMYLLCVQQEKQQNMVKFTVAR
jgi:hypothetical protein